MAAAKLIAIAPRAAVAAEPPARIRNPRYRGLHLVVAGDAPASRPEDTQAQARRIVAQVECEIEQQAAREQRATFDALRNNVDAKHEPKPVAKIESPATAARRLLNAFRLFTASA